jgi:hypothetical protein
MKELREDYVTEAGSCTTADNAHQLTFMSFLGLWILLWAAIGVAFIILGVDVFIKWRKRKAQGADEGDSGSDDGPETLGKIRAELETQAELITQLKKLI